MAKSEKKLAIVVFSVLIAFGVMGCREGMRDEKEGDPLFRTVLDPFDHLNGAPTVPRDPVREEIRFSEKEWGDVARDYFKMKPRYLVGWQQKVRLPAFPANTSPRTRMELDYLVMLQEKRTQEHLSRIEAEKEFDVFYLGRSLGTKFNGNDLPVTKVFFKRILDEFAMVALLVKKDYARARPHVLDSRIHPAIPVPAWAAYPSGHSTVAFAYAFILQELFPHQIEKFQEAAFLIAWHREVAGLHYPSDTSSGKLLAREIVDQLLETPSFCEDLEKAKKELEAAGFK